MARLLRATVAEMYLNLSDQSTAASSRSALRRLAAAIAVAAALAAMSSSCVNFPWRPGGRAVPQADTISRVDTVYPLGFRTDSFECEAGSVKGGEIFTALMGRLGLSREEALALSEVGSGVLDPTKMRSGDTFRAYYAPAVPSGEERGPLQYLVYDIDRIHQAVLRCVPPYGAWRYDKPVEHELAYADISIRTSLWADMNRSGVPVDVIVRLSEIYAWTVDFFGLQPGDHFEVVYDLTRCEGEVVSVDTVHYARYQRDTVLVPAVRLDQGDGGGLYWRDDGQSLQRAFLKAPLQFTRISSGFTYHRVHPVHGDVRAHTAVDYAAPTGTPVMSIGDGTVISRGWAGGGGNTVKVRHNSVYTTSYMHLSRFAGIKVGDRVRQGQVIGYVGMTGTATGPHLDFRVYKNGTPVNPLTLESPSDEPLKPENMPLLDSLNRRWRAVADSLGAACRAVAADEAVDTQ